MKEERGRVDRAATEVWVRDEEKGSMDEPTTAAASTNKRKRAAPLWCEDDDGAAAGRTGGRGRDRRDAEEEEQSGLKSSGNDSTKQPFMSGTAALALDAAKRGHLGGGGGVNGGHSTLQTGGVSGARPSGLANSKRKFAPPRPINAVPELAEAVPPMVRAALAGPTTADSYTETDPIKAEKLKGTFPLHALRTSQFAARVVTLVSCSLIRR